uniref:Uncharacterized protein n=1 Tax=Myoviridae sp. ct5xZ3 TaxID=2827601 RepID=A0A8S5RSF9_9CAUD|nr:MAG TPA: hypothetical protein [Myoviridae sp. ct5xZ3]
MNFSFPVCNSSFVILYLISIASPMLQTTNNILHF